MAHEDDENSLPADLIEQIKQADKTLPLITSRVDCEIRRLAARQFSAREKTWWQQRMTLATAAGVAAAVWIAVQLVEPRVDDSQPVYADLDGSGQIDIADVLRLARDRGGAAQAQIDAFAMRIVALKPADGSS